MTIAGAGDDSKAIQAALHEPTKAASCEAIS